MQFRGRGRPFTAAGLQAALNDMGLAQTEMPRLWAILTIESRGFGFQSDRRPKILFERHVFSRRTNHRFDKSAPDISSPDAGGYSGGAAEYDRLQKAIDLLRQVGDPPEIALSSASWGLPQIMGFNYGDVGFASATDLVNGFLDEEDAHLAAMAGFINANNLASKLENSDWLAVATVYNGSGNAHHYAGLLKEAFEKFRGGVDRDLSVRTAQAALLYLGFGGIMGSVDGILGDNTRRAIRAWRIHAGFSDSDRLDGEIYDRLLAAAGF